MHGPTCTFWANLTPFSLKVHVPPKARVDLAAGRAFAAFGFAVADARWSSLWIAHAIFS
jgi:hypothetical protein